jgi:hypothetical protein
MEPEKQSTILIDFLYQPTYKVWRHLFIIVAIASITLSQSFFVFGNHLDIATSTIYATGIGLAAVMLFGIYINVYYLSPYFLSKRAYASYIIILLILVSGFIILKQELEYLIFSSVGVFRQFNTVTLLDGASNMILYTICIASTAISTLIRQLTADNTVINHLQNEQLQHNISKIKNSIQPKFLFATLDYVSKNVNTAPDNTSSTLFKLSELLRYQLYDSTRKKVLLDAEIDFIRNYLQLQKQSSTNGFNFEINTIGSIQQFIAPNRLMILLEEILNAQPQYLQLIISNDNEMIIADCEITGVSNNLFEIMEQKLQMIYKDEISTSSQANANQITLRIC